MVISLLIDKINKYLKILFAAMTILFYI